MPRTTGGRRGAGTDPASAAKSKRPSAGPLPFNPAQLPSIPRTVLKRYDPENTPRIAKIAVGLGATRAQLGEMFQVVPGAIDVWCGRYPEMKQACDEGRDDFLVRRTESSLDKRANGYDYTEVKTKSVTIKSGKGDDAIALPAEEVTVTTHHVPPDVGAIVFTLVNRTRSSGRWQHVQRVEVGGPNGAPIPIITGEMTEQEARAAYQATVRSALSAQALPARGGAAPRGKGNT